MYDIYNLQLKKEKFFFYKSISAIKKNNANFYFIVKNYTLWFHQIMEGVLKWNQELVAKLLSQHYPQKNKKIKRFNSYNPILIFYFKHQNHINWVTWKPLSLIHKQLWHSCSVGQRRACCDNASKDWFEKIFWYGAASMLYWRRRKARKWVKVHQHNCLLPFLCWVSSLTSFDGRHLALLSSEIRGTIRKWHVLIIDFSQYD